MPRFAMVWLAAALGAAFLLGLAGAGALRSTVEVLEAPGIAGPRHTARRPGDLVVYSFGCHSRAALQRALEGGSTARALLATRSCFIADLPISALLLEFVDGPFDGPAGGATASIWRVRDGAGDIEFIALVDRPQ